MTHKCEDCRLWKRSGTGPYGYCHPEKLPFWSAVAIPDMTTQTRRDEGEICEAFSPRGSA
jgi:hypothetical protein